MHGIVQTVERALWIAGIVGIPVIIGIAVAIYYAIKKIKRMSP